ncbi:ribonuclease P protein component [Bernardetia litoralis DSM 6794]|uniref:Ribonuclease P protein component n=1 Tax=Bernardetia litoralis (strain ATCC 23117 / DSM 6794 / NBRC 15988 / NCIMB 1366 / Fx l1 / Sio-4) TaxID=880071 RepID=I4APV7_BERLS|nr:ribonuclease P protein component [Bernardetia litoralis]AFM05992.1 ribonuclease P protein component [Bernardetia litoralis DSM 6794]
MQTSKKTFSKKERLSSVKDIETLFKKGKSLFVFPLKVVFIPKKLEDITEENNQKVIPPARLLVSVSKRNFKKAVDRNHIKRQIREGYRLQKSEFDLSHIDTFAFISVSKEHINSKFLHKRIKRLLQMLEKEK